MIVSNLGVILANVPQGGAPVPTPTATSAVPSPTATVPAAATATALPVSTATPVPTATSVVVPGCYIQVSSDGVNWRPRRVDNVSMAALLCGRS